MVRFCTLGILLLVAGVSLADTAVLDNGRRVSGKLQSDPEGRWSFQPAGAAKALPRTRLWLVRLTETPPATPLTGPVFRATLVDGQVVTGRWQSLDAKACTLSTAGMGAVVLPRDALLSLWYDDPAAPPQGPNLSPHRIDASQDELWLATGDQLFGKVLAVGPQHVDFAARFGKERYSWGAVQGLFFQGPKPATRKNGGHLVRLWLWSGQGNKQDLIHATLRSLDDRSLTIQHPLLGTRRIERPHVARISWLFR